MRYLNVAAACGLLLGAGSIPAHSQEALSAFGIFEENDTFTSSDSSYTQGLRVNFVFRWPGTGRSEDSAQGTFGLWQCISKEPPIIGPCGQLTLAIGQSIYTPDSINVRERRPQGRPYAGLLYFAPGVQVLRQFELFERPLDTSFAGELLLGVTGPLSFAEEAQTLFHWGFAHGALRPKGWKHQIKHAVIVNPRVSGRLRAIEACYWNGRPFHSCEESRAKRLFDLIPTVEAAAGNLQRYIGAGIVARAGWDVPSDFGAALIPTTAVLGESEEPRFGIGVILGASGRRMFYNRFIEGGCVDDAGLRMWTEIEAVPTVSEITAGGFLSLGEYVLNFQYVWRSREFTVPNIDEARPKLRFANISIVRTIN